MKLMLRASVLTGMFHEHPAGTMYWKPVDRPYPGVPRKGEMLAFDDSGEHSVEITNVEWDASGEVVIDLGGEWNVEELTAAGFSDTRSSAPWTIG